MKPLFTLLLITVNCLLITAQAAGPFQVNGDGTVTDTTTGLMWQQQDDDVNRTWDEAQNYCDNLSLASYTDWFLPNVYELRTLPDYTTYEPSIDNNIFPGTDDRYGYWTATTDAIFTLSSAWIVYFLKGDVKSDYQTDTNRVRCVRAGPRLSDNLDTLVVSDSQVVTDSATGLVWQREDDNTYRTWEQAQSYCDTLTLGGYNDWRLPTVEELQRLTDYSRYSPASDANLFPGTDNALYWIGTSLAYDPAYAWIVYFYNGSVYSVTKTFIGQVRCVRVVPRSFDDLSPLILTISVQSNAPPLTWVSNAPATTTR